MFEFQLWVLLFYKNSETKYKQEHCWENKTNGRKRWALNGCLLLKSISKSWKSLQVTYTNIHVRYTELSDLIRYIPPPVEYWRVYPKFHCFWNHKWQIKLHDHIKSLMSLNQLIIASVSQFSEVSCSPCNCCCQFPEFKHWLVTGLWAGRLLQQVVWAGQVRQVQTVRTNQSRVLGASWPMRGRVITSPGCTELPGAQVSQEDQWPHTWHWDLPGLHYHIMPEYHGILHL